MGKSENGPDMRDCATYAIAIEEATQCSIAVLVEPVGSSLSASWRVGVVASSKELTVTGPAWSLSTNAVWPCRRHKTFDGCLYALIVELDAKVAQRAFQEVLDIA